LFLSRPLHVLKIFFAVEGGCGGGGGGGGEGDDEGIQWSN
jgi:hypothetical protein